MPRASALPSSDAMIAPPIQISSPFGASIIRGGTVQPRAALDASIISTKRWNR
jgi:hypothetical protein